VTEPYKSDSNLSRTRLNYSTQLDSEAPGQLESTWMTLLSGLIWWSTIPELTEVYVPQPQYTCHWASPVALENITMPEILFSLTWLNQAIAIKTYRAICNGSIWLTHNFQYLKKNIVSVKAIIVNTCITYKGENQCVLQYELLILRTRSHYHKPSL